LTLATSKAGVWEKAAQASCISNLKQIAMAMKMYTSDWAGILPAPPGPGDGGGGNDMWWLPIAGVRQPNYGTGLAPYLGATRTGSNVWICPSHPQNIKWSVGAGQEKYFPHMSSYLANDYRSGPQNSYDYYSGMLSQDKIAYPAMYVIFGEGYPNWVCCRMEFRSLAAWPDPTGLCDVGLTNDPPYWPYKPSSPTYPVWGTVIAWHNGKCNFAFIDGHAKAMDLGIMAHETAQDPASSSSTATINPYYNYGNT